MSVRSEARLGGALLAVLIMLLGCGSGPSQRTAAPGASESLPSPSPTTAAGTPLLPPPGATDVGQTAAEPSADAPVFHAEMSALWTAVQMADPGRALPAFFPMSAYVQLKALRNDAADWRNRLLAHFELDVEAAHRVLGADASGAEFVQVIVPTAAVHWVAPGQCANRLGYWHAPGSRMVYQVDGQTRSFGIASLISWRGYWYVVHLGSVQPPAGQGVVDGPATGVGPFTPTHGC